MQLLAKEESAKIVASFYNCIDFMDTHKFLMMKDYTNYKYISGEHRP